MGWNWRKYVIHLYNKSLDIQFQSCSLEGINVALVLHFTPLCWTSGQGFVGGRKTEDPGFLGQRAEVWDPSSMPGKKAGHGRPGSLRIQ